MSTDNSITRREFVASSTKAAAGALLLGQMPTIITATPRVQKKRLAMVGTGHRGTGMWGTGVLKSHGDIVEFVGLCDSNPGRVETAKKMMGVSCPTFTNFEQMIEKTRWDATSLPRSR
jgi:hypothetical protein